VVDRTVLAASVVLVVVVLVDVALVDGVVEEDGIDTTVGRPVVDVAGEGPSSGSDPPARGVRATPRANGAPITTSSLVRVRSRLNQDHAPRAAVLIAAPIVDYCRTP
jgi:hypothetical protein